MSLSKYIQILLNYDFSKNHNSEREYLNQFSDSNGEPVKFVLLFDIDYCLYYSEECHKAEARNVRENEMNLMNEWRENPLNAGAEPLTFKELKRKYGSSRIGMHNFYHKNIEEIMKLDFNRVEDYIEKNEELKNVLNNINLPKYCFTNAFPHKARKILQKLDVENCFGKIFCTIDETNDINNWITKPMPEAYNFVKNYLNLSEKTKIVFFDDTLANLDTAKKMGWITYHVTPNQPIIECIKKFKSEYIPCEPFNSKIFRDVPSNKVLSNPIISRA